MKLLNSDPPIVLTTDCLDLPKRYDGMSNIYCKRCNDYFFIYFIMSCHGYKKHKIACPHCDRSEVIALF